VKISNLKMNHKTILWSGIVLYVIILTAISWFKYYQFGYNGLDLAIIHNSFFNATLGNGFWSSVQGNYYFAYHFSPILYLILPIYWLWRSPLNLLFLQSIILGLSAWPVYLLAKKIINPKIALWVALAWLVNPLLMNINLYEWHALSLAVPLLITTYYFYHTKRLGLFTIFMLLSFAIREDIVIVIFMIGVLALIAKRKLVWILFPTLGSILYLFLSYWYINSLSLEGSRFITYYQWFFQSTPWEWLLHLLKLGNIEMVIGLTLAFLFLPWLKPKYLLLSIGPFLQIALLESGGSSIVTGMHYSTLFLPGLLVASLWGLNKIVNGKDKLARFIKYDLTLTKLIVVVCLIYLVIFLGPAWGIIKQLKTPYPNAKQVRSIIKKIPRDAKVAASYTFLPWLSSRAELYSLHYIITSKQQFSNQDYKYDKPNYIMTATDDFTTIKLQFYDSRYLHNFYSQGFGNFKNLINDGYKIRQFNNQWQLWQQADNNEPWEKEIDRADFLANNSLPDFQLQPFAVFVNKKDSLLNINFTLSEKTDKDYWLEITINNTEFIRPLTLLTPTSQWQTNKVYSSFIYLPPATDELKIKLINFTGHIELNDWGGIINKIDQLEAGPEIKIPLL